jgi:hypothetical protein
MKPTDDAPAGAVDLFWRSTPGTPPTPWQDPNDLDYREFVELHRPAGDDSPVASR